MAHPAFVHTRQPHLRTLPKGSVTNQDIRVALVTNLPLHRQRLGYSQHQLAALVGVNPSSYGAYEEGRSEPAYRTLRHLAQEFGITTDQLLGTGRDG